MSQKKEVEKIDNLFSYLGKNSLKQTKAFASFMDVVEQDGKVSSKIKEAVALGIAIKSQCKGCIAFHTKKALDKGFSKEEIIEIAWVAVLMGGGPSLVYMSHVKEALEEFLDE
ncbi:MAG: carboxymuconolactone decarboxylase family protein [Candidatus Nanoarchaeia archaeon]